MVCKKSLFVLGILLIGMGFVFAAVAAPTGVYFSENSTTLFDEDGTVFLNWTAGGIDEANYTIFVSIDGGTSWFLSANNDSETGYVFTNTTDANYTFVVQANNDTLDTANSSEAWIFIDDTHPAIEYGGGVQIDTANASQNFIFVNITATDTYNESIIFSLYNTTGIVNETVFSDSYATLTINWTSLSDGVYYYNITANDSATNTNYTSTYKITLDTTAPTLSSYSCTPATVRVGETVSCSCLGADAGSGVNTTSYTGGPSTSSVGSFSETCTVTDYAGNSFSDTAGYEVTSSSSSSSSSGNTNIWKKTFVPSGEQFQNGYTQNLKEQERAKLTINNIYHYVGVDKINSNSVDLIITSDPIEITLSVGENEKVDVNDDDFYDLYLYLESLDSDSVDLTILSINEEIANEGLDIGLLNNATGGDEDTSGKNKAKKNLSWLWIVLGILGLTVIVYGIYWLLNNKK
jgi:hypothetical protein